jgi:hypothetical protein
MRELSNDIVYVHLFVRGIQDFGGVAVWVVPVSAKELFLFAMYFKGLGHGKIVIVVQMLWISHG